MEAIKRLIARFWPTGALFIGGLFLILYFAFGFLYFQQGAKQKEIQAEINKLSLILANPLPSVEELQAEYDEVNAALTPLTVPAILEIIVDLADRSGIDIDPSNEKFHIPHPDKPREQKVGTAIYMTQSFREISAQGNYDSVMAFISALESGEMLMPMVLKKVNINKIAVEDGTETLAILDVDLYTKPGGDSP